MKVKIVFTVFFEKPFWVGVFKRTYDNCLETCRVVFGAEPKDYEVYLYFLENYNYLKFSRPVHAEDESWKRKNPKRMQREVRKQTASSGIGTKAQQAIKQEYEYRKAERKKLTKLHKEEIKKMKFNNRQQKKKEKKKGH